MPLPKSLQPRRCQSTKSTQKRRKTCKVCNHLDPRDHPRSFLQSDSSKVPIARLTLVLDTFTLSRTLSPKDGGCRFCHVLVQVLDAFFVTWKKSRLRIQVDLTEKGSIKVSLDAEKSKSEAVEIYATSALNRPWPSLGTVHHIPIDSGSDDSFDFARRCIETCLSSPKHGACRPKMVGPDTIPKRLLDVGRAKSAIRVIDTEGKPFQYASLSHRWGTCSTLSLTESNWRELNSSIEFEHLPPLFQDAVVVTRQLGLRYIWIDSLCILQDSARDWETESSKMGAIYEHSYITISATNCNDSQSRCLVDRAKPVRIVYENTTGKEFAIRARKILEHHPIVEEVTPAQLIGPLVSRAWVLQEQVLSTRILHYTATEILFECKSSTRCECMPTSKLGTTTPSLIPKAAAQKSRRTQGLCTAWQRLVEQYSNRDLTIASDKLPAISGIAKKLQNATKFTYIAGLWKENIIPDLLWTVSPNTASDTGCYALEKYRAPTFSWASLDAGVSYYTPDAEEQEDFKQVAKLLQWKVSPIGLNPLGTVSDAWIKLRGPCISAMLSSAKREGRWDYTLLIKGTSAIGITQDCLLVEVTPEGSDKAETTVRRARAGDSQAEFQTSVLCLSVARYSTWITGLVLGKSERVPGSYERLGNFAAGTEVFQNSKEKVLQLV